MTLARKLWRRGRDLLPFAGFHHHRPPHHLPYPHSRLVAIPYSRPLHSGVGIHPSHCKRPYDCYSLETADDLMALAATLKRHRDSSGRNPCVEMNFIVANLDFARMACDNYRTVHTLPLSEGLPQGWNRPKLIEGFRRSRSRPAHPDIGPMTIHIVPGCSMESGWHKMARERCCRHISAGPKCCI